MDFSGRTIMVIGLSGRRIDPEDASEVRFPAAQAAQVGQGIQSELERMAATVLVSSAACGTDILGLEAAGLLGMRRRVVLPFDRHRFRETSVVDRPGNWGPRYDALLDALERHDEVVVLGFDVGDSDAYTAANDRILWEVETIARELGTGAGALIVWDGKSRGPDDATENFQSSAEKRGLVIRTVNTLQRCD